MVVKRIKRRKLFVQAYLRTTLRSLIKAARSAWAIRLNFPVVVFEDSHMISSRTQVTEMIVSAKVRKGLKWADVADKVGMAKEWTTAACLGQMQLSKEQAAVVGEIFELSDEAIAWLQIVPYKGSLPTAVPTDPLIYRWYELVNVYGTTIKELIHEEFGDGIMSAIDFSMDIQRQADAKGDRVNVVLSGKFLPYKAY